MPDKHIITVYGDSHCPICYARSPLELVRAADGAVYTAQQSGRNSIRAA